MDRQHADAAIETMIDAPIIERVDIATDETFVPAAQSPLLNGILGAAWAYHLFTIFTFVSTGAPSEEIPTLLYSFAVGLDLLVLFGALGAVALAAHNSKATAPVSFALATASIMFASLCGIVGHPSSAWLSDLAFGVVVAAASMAVFARRAKPEPSVA